MKRVLKVGIDSAAPFPMHTDYNSSVFEGFEVDLLKVIAEHLDLEVHYEVSLWKNILKQLYKGELDMICSAVTMTPSRQRILEFSEPYLQFRLCAVVKDNEHLYETANFKNKIIGVRVATEAEKYIMDQFPNYLLVHADTNKELYEQLLKGKIDVLIDDSPIAGGFLKKHSSLKIGLFLPDTDSHYAIAMRKGDVKLKNEINEVLRAMKKSGTYQNIFTKWFTQIQL